MRVSPEGELDVDPETLDDFRDGIKHGEKRRPPQRVIDNIRKNFVKYPAEASGKMAEAVESTVDIAPPVNPDGQPNQTSYCLNHKNIFLSFHNVPRNMRDIPDAVLAVFNGLALHEVGHVIFTKERKDEWDRWMKRQSNQRIAHRVMNLVEDARINHRLTRRFERLQGQALLAFDRVHASSWVYGIEQMCKATKARYEKDGDSWSGKLPARALLSIAEVRGLHAHLLGPLPDKLISDWFPLVTKEQLKDMQDFENILQKAKRFSNFNDELRPAASALYDIEAKYWLTDNQDRQKGQEKKPKESQKQPPKKPEEEEEEEEGGEGEGEGEPGEDEEEESQEGEDGEPGEGEGEEGEPGESEGGGPGEGEPGEPGEGEGEGEGGEPGEGEPGEGEGDGQGGEPGEGEPGEPGEEGADGPPSDISDLDPTSWIPTFNEGHMEPDAPTPVVKEWEAHDRATEVELEKKKELNKEAQKGKKGGGGAGRDIKPPEIDLNDFNERRIRLTKQIQEMKDMLKFKTAPRLVTQKYQRGGRMMSGILARAAVTGQRREVRNIYQLPRYQYEENDVMMALLVDMSGSTDPEVMKDSFVLLAEAASSWMPQENFSLWAFGSDFQRIKDFTEDYQHIKGRIGGMKDLGGTVISPALFKIGKMFHELRQRSGVKMILILSDYQLSDPEAIEFLDKMANEENVIPMLIANGGYDESVESARTAAIAANKWCGGRYPIVLMPKAIDLPRRFLETYKVFANMSPKDLESGRWRERFKGSVQTFGGSP
jgi:hypothetical protein